MTVDWNVGHSLYPEGPPSALLAPVGSPLAPLSRWSLVRSVPVNLVLTGRQAPYLRMNTRGDEDTFDQLEMFTLTTSCSELFD